MRRQNRINEPFLINPPRTYRKNPLEGKALTRAENRIKYHANKISISCEIIEETLKDMGFSTSDTWAEIRRILRDASSGLV